MEGTIQLQIDPMHPVTKELLQRRRSRPASELAPPLTDALVSAHNKCMMQHSTKAHAIFVDSFLINSQMCLCSHLLCVIKLDWLT